ncbi:hypothetical protein CYLTODRAFT_468746, partial [Cylindrobasidium torrendii FP15055 ss-10]
MASLDTILVDSLEEVVQAVDALSASTSIAVDLEGINLGRQGRACIMQLFSEGSGTIYLVDLTVLGHVAFDTPNEAGESLRSILEGEGIRKVFWDVRNDSDALHYHYQVDLRNCFDLQVLEVFGRRSRGETSRCVNGLAKSMSLYGIASWQWTSVKDAGAKLFAPEQGGRYEVFEERPLDSRLVQYCAQDVGLMFKLEAAIRRKCYGILDTSISRETEARVRASKAFHYNGKGRHMALATFSSWN